MTGRFITLEGGEGAGKSTQLKRLAEALRGRGLTVIETREPGGSPGAEAIRDLLLGGDQDRWTPAAEALLFAAARADHVARTIRPALQRGDWVLCDRFIDSSLAYQGLAGGLGEAAVRQLHAAAGRARDRDNGEADRIGAREAAYHDAVAAGFATLAAREPERIRRIDASGTPEEVTSRLIAAIEDLL
jgi:dTMP kinase